VEDYRKHIRLPIVMGAEFKLTVGDFYMGRTKNIGRGGLFVRFQDKPLVHHDDRCSVSLLLNEKVRRVALKCQCRVIHQDRSGIGFKFHSIDFAYLAYLSRLLRPHPSTKLAEDLKTYFKIVGLVKIHSADGLIPPRRDNMLISRVSR
jgi:hypothetical protein